MAKLSECEKGYRRWISPTNKTTKLTLRQIACRLRSLLNADGLYCGKERVSRIQYCETTKSIYARLEKSGSIPVVRQDLCGIIAPTASGELLKSCDGNDKQIWRLTGDKRSLTPQS